LLALLIHRTINGVIEMDVEELTELQYPSVQIFDFQESIYNGLINVSTNIHQGNFNSIATSDLSIMFSLYDEYFFNGSLNDEYPDAIFFNISSRMTKAAGKTTQYLENGIFVISISSTLIFQSFKDVDREIKVNGLVCQDRLEAMMCVFEHELVHLLELLAFDNSSCKKQRFKQISRNLFGHTDVTHQLITQYERAKEKYDMGIGDEVSFEYEGEEYIGIIYRITKRVTVMVKDENGNYEDSNGNSYLKYYVPLFMLTKIEA